MNFRKTPPRRGFLLLAATVFAAPRHRQAFASAGEQSFRKPGVPRPRQPAVASQPAPELASRTIAAIDMAPTLFRAKRVLRRSEELAAF